MVQAVEAHNDIVESEDPIIVSQVDTALQEKAEPAYRADRGFRLIDAAVAKLGKGTPPVAAGKDEGTTLVEPGANNLGHIVPGTTPVEEANGELGATETDETAISVPEPGDKDLGQGVPRTTPVEKENGELESTKTVESSLSGGEPGAQDLGETTRTKSARLRACSRETLQPRNIRIGSALRQFSEVAVITSIPTPTRLGLIAMQDWTYSHS